MKKEKLRVGEKRGKIERKKWTGKYKNGENIYRIGRTK